MDVAPADDITDQGSFFGTHVEASDQHILVARESPPGRFWLQRILASDPLSDQAVVLETTPGRIEAVVMPPGTTPIVAPGRGGQSDRTNDEDTTVRADIDAIDNRGNSALNYAASQGRSSSVYRRLTTAKHKSNEIIVVIPERS